jgi:outer membrane lipoprotein SlyB
MRTPTYYSVVLRFLSILLIAGLMGCASTQTTSERTETITEPVDTVPSGTEFAVENAGATKRETTVTTTTEEKRHPGIIGSTVGVAGAVVAAPFRVIGGVLGAVF